LVSVTTTAAPTPTDQRACGHPGSLAAHLLRRPGHDLCFAKALERSSHTSQSVCGGDHGRVSIGVAEVRRTPFSGGVLEGRPPSGTSANPTTTITSADVATDNYCRCCPVSSRSPLAFLAIRDSLEDVSPHRVTSGSPMTLSLNVYDDDLSACSYVSHISAPSRLIAIDPAITRLQPTLVCV